MHKQFRIYGSLQSKPKQYYSAHVLLKLSTERRIMLTTYLDWAATTPLRPEASQAMMEILQPGLEGLRAGGANANALYTAGRDAFKLLEQTRRMIAATLHARPDEIIFTSGSTEANNTALYGMTDALMLEREEHADHDDHDCVPRIVVSSIEHDSVLEAAAQLGMWGAEIVAVNPDSSGHITPEALARVCNDHTILVSIMMVNNEIGSVMNIAELADVAHSVGALFHTDATQAAGKMPVNVVELGVDALSLSAHKFGGPKGCGVLYLKAHTPFSPQIVGGGQELHKRSGTQNVASVVGMGCALEASCIDQELEYRRLQDLRDYCYAALTELPGVKAVVNVLPGDESYAPHIVNVTVEGFESQTLIMQLDRSGIAVSGGSACSSDDLDPSHVLRALGISRDRALDSLRVSLGWLTTKYDIDILVEAVKKLIATKK